MDASLLRMVTRDLDAPRALAANDRAVIDRSRPVFEADEPCNSPLDLLSGNFEVLLSVNRYQLHLRPNNLMSPTKEKKDMNAECVQTLDRWLTRVVGPI
jgi:hypothetical protein